MKFKDFLRGNIITAILLFLFAFDPMAVQANTSSLPESVSFTQQDHPMKHRHRKHPRWHKKHCRWHRKHDHKHKKRMDMKMNKDKAPKNKLK